MLDKTALVYGGHQLSDRKFAGATLRRGVICARSVCRTAALLC